MYRIDCMCQTSCCLFIYECISFRFSVVLQNASQCVTMLHTPNDIQFLECNLTTANSFILIGPELFFFFLSQCLLYSHFPIIWLIKQVTTFTPCTCEKASVSQKENWQTCEAFDRCGMHAHGHSLHLSLSFSFFPFQSSYSDSWAQSYISHFVSHTHTHMLCESPVLSVCCCEMFVAGL